MPCFSLAGCVGERGVWIYINIYVYYDTVWLCLCASEGHGWQCCIAKDKISHQFMDISIPITTAVCVCVNVQTIPPCLHPLWELSHNRCPYEQMDIETTCVLNATLGGCFYCRCATTVGATPTTPFCTYFCLFFVDRNVTAPHAPSLLSYFYNMPSLSPTKKAFLFTPLEMETGNCAVHRPHGRPLLSVTISLCIPVWLPSFSLDFLFTFWAPVPALLVDPFVLCRGCHVTISPNTPTSVV